MDEFYEWWDALYETEGKRHDTTCADGDFATPCTGRDRDFHIRAAYLLPVLQNMVRKSGIYAIQIKEAN